MLNTLSHYNHQTWAGFVCVFAGCTLAWITAMHYLQHFLIPLRISATGLLTFHCRWLQGHEELSASWKPWLYNWVKGQLPASLQPSSLLGGLHLPRFPISLQFRQADLFLHQDHEEFEFTQNELYGTDDHTRRDNAMYPTEMAAPPKSLQFTSSEAAPTNCS